MQDSNVLSRSEVWMEVDGHPNFIVSNKEHLINTLTNNSIIGYTHEGYRVVTLDDGDYKFHRIVAKAFPEICGLWFDGCIVHHKDRNKLNNKPENLMVISRSEHQIEHNKERDYCEISIKVLNTIKKRYPFGRNAKIIEQYDKNGIFIKEYKSIKQASDYNNLDPATICNALKGKIKTYGGYIWKYKKDDE